MGIWDKKGTIMVTNYLMVKISLVLNFVGTAALSTVMAIFRQVFVEVMVETEKLLGVVG